MNRARNHTNHCVGEWHGKAKHTDATVREVQALHAQGLGYRKISFITGIAQSTVRDWLTQRTRWSA